MPPHQDIGLRSDDYVAFMDGLYEGLRDVGGQVVVSHEGQPPAAGQLPPLRQRRAAKVDAGTLLHQTLPPSLVPPRAFP